MSFLIWTFDRDRYNKLIFNDNPFFDNCTGLEISPGLATRLVDSTKRA